MEEYFDTSYLDKVLLNHLKKKLVFEQQKIKTQDKKKQHK